MVNGADFTAPALSVEEKRRSQSSRESKDRRVWDASDVAVFKPERWLVQNEKGEVEFDSRAGPNLPFGLGPRGCFGELGPNVLLPM